MPFHPHYVAVVGTSLYRNVDPPIRDRVVAHEIDVGYRGRTYCGIRLLDPPPTMVYMHRSIAARFTDPCKACAR